MKSRVRVAIVHDWLTGRRGGEKVLEVLLDLFPHADLYTLIHHRGKVPQVETRRIRTSWLQRLGLPGRSFQWLLPLFNHAARRLPLRSYDLVISLSHCAAKNVLPSPNTPHLCYCLTPARYAWDLFDDYVRAALGPLSSLLRGPALRFRDAWRREDLRGNQSVHCFLAISHFVKDRLQRCYGRGAEVLYPPVETELFARAALNERVGERFLVLSASRPNKRVGEVVEACARLGLGLDVVGAGSARELGRLRELGGSGVVIHGELSDEAVRTFVARCRGLIHAATEDFGLAPVEAMAAGRPVIGYEHSGLGETVVDGRTGVLFEDPSVAGIQRGIGRFLELESSFSRSAIRERAGLFSRARFEEEFRAAVLAFLENVRV